METKDSLDLALKFATIGAALLQFFVVGTLAVIGWFLTVPSLISTHSFAQERVIFALAYLVFSIAIYSTYYRLLQRVSAALSLASEIAPEGLKERAAFKALAGGFKPWIVQFVFPVLIIFVCGVLLLLTRTPTS